MRNKGIQEIYNWTEEELEILKKLSTPDKIQEFIDSISYSEDPVYRSPRTVIKDRKAHCVDGAIFAAAALRILEYPPIIMEMTAERDDDHLIAVFKKDGRLGAIGKSNFTGLRFREPVYRTLRELVMSYFEFYYNIEAEKTMRGYSVLMNLEPFDKFHWTFRDGAIDLIVEKLEKSRHFQLLTPSLIASLVPVDSRSYKAGLLGVNEKGLYRPSKD